MKINFIKINPSDNMTVIILDPLPRDVQNDIATEVMKNSSIGAEQVAFLETVNKVNCDGLVESFLHLQMMGGELCANSPRALAALMHYRGHPEFKKDHEQASIELHISGVDDLVQCSVEKTNDPYVYISEMSHPHPRNISEIEFALDEKHIDVTRVDFEGITHFIVDESEVKSKMKLYDTIKFYMSSEEYTSFGVIFYDDKDEHITPLVYVKDTNSLVWEKSCGTGTVATAIALSHESGKDFSKKIRQPGGSLDVGVFYDESKEIEKLTIKGPIKLIAQGTLLI